MFVAQPMRAALIALALALPSAGAWGCAGEAVAMAAGKAFTAAAKTGSGTAFLNAASRYADVRGIAASALGPYRKKLTKAQEAEYFRLAPAFMGGFMARYASRFNASGMKVTTCSGSTVTATTNGGRKIIFRVSGGRVRDVNVSSVWLAGQMRSTFVSVIKRNGGDVNALLRYLR